jgi:thioredoxin reductase (NADPH)
MTEKKETVVALIGGGPACVTAAIQLTRAGLDNLLISDELGGKIRNANLVENLLGYPKGIDGEDLVQLIKQQTRKHNVIFLKRTVKFVEYKNVGTNAFRFVITTDKEQIQSKYLIVGTGSKPKKLGIYGEEEAFAQKKLFYENYEARKHVKEKNVIIVGGGDTAYDYALNIKDSASNISIVQRSRISKSIPILQTRAQKEENIKIISGVTLNKIKLDGKIPMIDAKRDDRMLPLIGDVIIVAIGREPNLDIISEKLLEVYEGKSENSKLYFVGDVKKDNYRQVSIAMGDGMKAAMEIVKEVTIEESYHGASREIW